MKAEDIIQNLTEDKIHKIVKEYMNRGSRRLDYCTNDEYFRAGAEWMLDNPTGGALLYAVEKTAERTKREMIKKAADWIEYMVIDYFQGDVTHIFTHEMISDFRKAMQDESK